MVAKIIVHGKDRDEAIRRLRAALGHAPLLGVRNNGGFLSDLVNHTAFRTATMTTALIDRWQEHREPLLNRPVPDDVAWSLAAAVVALQKGAGWRPNSVAASDMGLSCDGTTRVMRVQAERSGAALVTWAGQQCMIKLLGAQPLRNGDIRFEVNGITRKAVCVLATAALHVALSGHSFVFTEVSAFPDVSQTQDARRACAPVAGKVTQIQVEVGTNVTEDQMLICVEAMKMEMWVNAQAQGTVKAIHVQVGDQVESGALLLELDLHGAVQHAEDKQEKL